MILIFARSMFLFPLENIGTIRFQICQTSKFNSTWKGPAMYPIKSIKEVSNAEIYQMVQKMGSMKAAARELRCSWQTVSYALNGRRKGPEMRGKGVERAEVEMCSCCGQAPKMEGNRWLCECCWKGDREEYRQEDVYPCRLIGNGPMLVGVGR
jgi:DNA-binding transcriptional regulator YdaS (Cro superfamily)